MIRRLAAVLPLALSLSACGDRTEKAADPAPAAPPPVAATTTTPEYKATPSPTLEAVKSRGYLTCGVHPGLPGFAYPDVKGVWQGFDVDICRAVAAATLGDAKKVRFTVIDNKDRFGALQSGRIDVLSRNTSWTLARDAGLGLDFAGTTYFDGQGFMAPRALNLTSADELNGARICVQTGTASETNLADYFSARGLTYTPVPAASEEEARNAYQAEKCDAFSADVSALAASRSVLNSPNAHVILPTVISKEPLGPVVRQDDPAWSDIVRWTVYALILAEELGVNSKTAEGSLETASDPRTRRLLGLEDDYGSLLSLKKDWAYQAIRQVGSYDEIFRRNIGADSGLKLERGMNALWTAPKPGLLYAPPIR
ncbi:MAG: amino acid ABC transporter substrate-binding protein [Phenylobacterium sp.]|uniref:amino acid ABC transporter substrate-binding protein n=1 Tax=Phenylobacterium sp. TaxID=1871053 RepID=UPI00391DE8BE